MSSRRVAPGKEQETLSKAAPDFFEQGRGEGEARGKARGRVAGRIEGFVEGLRIALLQLLERRFGTLPAPVRERVEKAAGPEIDGWFDRAVDAPTLEAVFGPEEAVSSRVVPGKEQAMPSDAETEWMEKGRIEGEKRGRSQGRLEGMRSTLRRQLERRFDDLPARIRERIEKATKRELDEWSGRILDASSLDAIFDDRVFYGLRVGDLDQDELDGLARDLIKQVQIEHGPGRLVAGKRFELLRTLENRFGFLPVAVHQRVEKATELELDGWLARARDASDLEAVFGSEKR